MTSREAHLQEWSDTLQDFLDGALERHQRERFEAHLIACDICREHLARFERLDAKLASALPTMALDSAFDRRLLAQLDSSDEAARAAKRRKALLEMQAESKALARSWRRSLAIVIPGVIAGIALALTLSFYLGESDPVRTVIADGAASLGVGTMNLVRMAVTAMIGAGIGLGVTRWLTITSD